ncbi:MAG: PEP-CTERM sorting domain-containing protein [Phycisphaeraceae bacterium]|nr:PEP-CTERM sorting domain-containing protein [Phycisphaeraceae bacterium]
MKSMSIGIGLVALVIAGGTASGQLNTTSSYSVTHNYTFSTGGFAPFSRFNYGVSARAFEPPPGWDIQQQSGNWGFFGPGVFGVSRSAGKDRSAPGFIDAGATAGVSASVISWGGGIYQASMTSSGTAHARFPGHRAFASSALNTQIFAPWGWRRGGLVWRPIINDFVSGQASAIAQNRRVDPILFIIRDAQGETIDSGSFFDMTVDWLPSGTDDVAFTWDDQGLETGPLADLSIRIVMPENPYTPLSGLLEFEVTGGLVTMSTALGAFSGFGLPDVGANVAGGLSLPNFSNNFFFDYDFENVPNGDSIEFILDGGGWTDVPAPGSLALLGISLIAARRRRA